MHSDNFQRSSASGAEERQPQHLIPSADTVQHLEEAFSFVRHERDDVRKMAIRGIAEQSKDNAELWAFLASPQHGPRCIDALLQYLHVGGKHVLGDILTIFVNCSADGSCAEMLVQRKVVRKAMRLLDGMERSDELESYIRSVEELALMLLSNLTTSHVTAIDDLLQKDDEDMRGFYLGKLQVYYEKFGSGQEVGEKDHEEDPASGAEVEHPPKAPLPAPAPQRDLNRWILHILLNLTRNLDGQELLLEDEEWRGTLNAAMTSPNPRHRYLAAQCYRNCACSPKPQYDLLLKSDALITAVDQLNGKEPIEDIQLSLAEFIASMLESEGGIARLEGVNAQKTLSYAVAVSKEAHAAKAVAAACRVEVLEEDGLPVPQGPSIILAAPVCAFLEQSVLPYLDEIVDAYVAPGSDELD